MIYIRNLFTQDLRDGKQIAFPTEPSEKFFKFNFRNPDPARQITFKFKLNSANAGFEALDGTTISTRIYAAGSESRIDGELKAFLRDNLNAKINDIVVFRALNINQYEFEFIPSGNSIYDFYKLILRNRNHELGIVENQNDIETSVSTEVSNNNTIYYGAPGTGKSHRVDKIIESLDKHFYERVTFHPEFDNASFIGGYKPISVKVKYDEGENEYFENEVHYKFVPQAFTNIYERA